MKKIIKISALCLILIACEEANVSKISTQYNLMDGYSPLDLVVIDSCEYLLGQWGNGTVLTHKGNCKNHKINKQD